MVPWADFKTRFALYLNLVIETGESHTICMRSCNDEKLPKYFKDYARGCNPTHYYHRMPASVVMQGAKTAEMIYNTTGWLPLGGACMTGHYGFKPEGQKCFSWFTNDELVFAMYVDQLVTPQLLN